MLLNYNIKLKKYYKNIIKSVIIQEIREVYVMKIEIEEFLDKTLENFSHKVDKPPRLDFKTWLYLYITKSVKVEHMIVEEVKTKRRMYVKDSKKMKCIFLKTMMNIKNSF